MNTSQITNNSSICFIDLVNQIYTTHTSFKTCAMKAVNVSITVRNRCIGWYLVEFEQQGADRAEYGKNLLEKISDELSKKGMIGVTPAELSRFRQFYTTYPQILGTLSQTSLNLPDHILGTLSQHSQTTEYPSVEPLKLITHLSFSHLAELIKIDDPVKRLFYEVEAIKNTWGVRELRRQIHTLLYDRAGLSKNPSKLLASLKEETAPVDVSELIKSPFAFEFLGLQAKDIVYESDLERSIMDNLQNFLLEFGNGFCFEAKQKKILIEDEYFFVDLVFYHRILHCHVLVEIKVDEFKHEHI